MSTAIDPVPDGDAQTVLAERRAWVRYPSAIEGACQPLVKDSINQRWPAHICDLSARGVGLVLGSYVEVGSLISVELPKASRGGPRRLLARVVRSEAGDEGQWFLGCTFSIRLSQRELEEFLP